MRELEPRAACHCSPPERELDEAMKETAQTARPFVTAPSRAAGVSGTASHASRIARSLTRSPRIAGEGLLGLQTTCGNRFARRVVELARAGEGKAGQAELSSETEQAIDGARGGGRPLANGVREQMEGSLGADFSAVQVHTGGRSDSLARRLSARAFTTGNDIFFRRGEYDPGSSRGRELLAHELTHVVQQGGAAVRAKLTLGQPGDRYEQEADRTAREVMKLESRAVRRQEEDLEDETES